MTYCQKDSYFYIRKESTSNKTMYSPFYKLFHPKNEHKMKSTILPGFDFPYSLNWNRHVIFQK